MRAAILQVLNEPLIVADVKSEPLKVGQVLVRVLCATICGKQIDEITGRYGPDRYLPHLLGHEGCGDVVACGPKVTMVAPKDRVVMHWRKGSGIDADPPRYLLGDDFIGAGPVATFGKMVVVSENRLTKIGEWVPPRVASLMGCAVTTALGLIKNEAQLKPGQSIMVAGCGGVGLNIIQGAVLAKAKAIVAIDCSMKKLLMSLSYGATRILQVSLGESEDSVLARVLTKIGKSGVDVFVDCTGCLTIVKVGLTVANKIVTVAPSMYDNTEHLNILHSQGGMTKPNEDIPVYLNLYKKGQLDLDHLITHAFPLEKINEAITLVRTGEVGRVALEMV